MAVQIIENGGITAPKGYLTGAVYAGIKSRKSYKPDVAVLLSDRQATVAALFTTNRFCAAPVTLGRELLKKGVARGIVINSGNANAGTGARGIEDAKAVAAFAERLLGLESGEMFVCSTGVIGEYLPVEKIQQAVEKIVPTLSPLAGSDAAWAIMTTDKARKELAAELPLSGGTVRIGAMSKGSGMIHPNMATTLTFLTTDAAVDRSLLQSLLRDACDRSIHLLTIDGDTSTNDSIFLFANGASGVRVESEADVEAFADALNQICLAMAKKIAADGEGASRMMTVETRGLSTKETAAAVARAVASSTSVKLALGQGRLGWGEILTAVGNSAVECGDIAPDCAIRSPLGAVTLCENGLAAEGVESRLAQILSAAEVTVSLDFHQGDGCGLAYGCDLTDEYVRINGDYRS
ncbi:MAG: bifunctional glutamate N-acetyltransferase/amino-acid acetyltransferase ArgJ [Oscillospiraceae bacterium]|nr:bifunctional glutamate N-acetyltransferase/amino-acid acetyltransferase ArgJ [Oscillospiraceae bacterium]